MEAITLITREDRVRAQNAIDAAPSGTVVRIGGNRRTLDQNALMWKWATEVSSFLGDVTTTEVHAYNKLHFGVPILRETDEDFREVYDRTIKPLPYEVKMEIMGPPIDLPVTRRMTKKAHARYLDDVFAVWTGRGATLTMPEES